MSENNNIRPRANMNNGVYRVRLTKDASFVPAGDNNPLPIIMFRGACNAGYLTKDGKEAVDFIDFGIRGRRATEAVAKVLTKGRDILISASRLHTWSTTSASGEYLDHYRVMIEQFELLGAPRTANYADTDPLLQAPEPAYAGTEEPASPIDDLGLPDVPFA